MGEYGKGEEEDMKTVIMAGGRGTRIADLFPDMPKPLIPITSKTGETKPVLEWEIEGLRRQGFKEIILTVGYRAKQIQEYFEDGCSFGVAIEYFVEEEPLGNAGALFEMRDQLGDQPFLLLIADAMFDVDFNRMAEYHKSKNALVTLFTHPNNHPYDSSVLIADSSNAVTAWLTKEEQRPLYYRNRVNAGLQIIDPKVLDMMETDPVSTAAKDENCKIRHIDLDRQILKPLCGKGVMFCYDSPEYCKDMGTSKRYEQVSQDFRSGIIVAKNLKNKQKAIFLDRDGTINRHIGFLRRPEEFELLEGVTEAIMKINNSGYLCIVVTNQPVIARGEVTVEELKEIHDKLETELGKTGAYIDGLYYCPHHPHSGYKGEMKELKIECNCRKPNPGLILKAAENFNIDLSCSWMIGDSANDIGAGKNAGCKTVLIGEGEYCQDMTAKSLLESVIMILDKTIAGCPVCSR